MGQLVSLDEYKAKHHPGYLRGIILDTWVMWNKGQTPSSSGYDKPQTPACDGWTKAESDKKVAEDRKQANERVKKSYKVGSKRNG